MKFIRFLFSLFFVLLALEAKAPELSPHLTKQKIEEILTAHSTHKNLSDEVILRLMGNFIENLDPIKCEFIESEIADWLNPSDDLIKKIREGIIHEDFTLFSSLMNRFKEAVERRNRLEEEIKLIQEFPEVKPDEFKKKIWVKNEAELKDKLLKIKALRFKTAQNLSSEEIDKFQKKLIRNRQKRLNDLLGSTQEEEKKNLYAQIIKALASALDNHTAYFTPSEAIDFIIQVDQRLFGIGAQLRDDYDGLSIVRLVEGGPALASKQLKIGDKIIAVNNEPLIGMDLVESVEMIRGPQDTSVNLTILRKNEDETETTLQVKIVRKEIVLKESRFEANYEPCGDGIIVHLHLYSFYEDPSSSSAKDLKNAFIKLKKEHKILGVVLDLRDNGGGRLSQAVEVASLFLGKGIIASIKDYQGNIKHLRNLEDSKVFDGPLVVLVNKASASASEIVAQTLQDYGRAIIIGDNSFGNGTYQSFTIDSTDHQSINPTGEYKVTQGMYYTVSGKTPQLNGVIADIPVPGLLSEMEIGEKFSKNPLVPDSIKPNFHDDLSDIHPLHRFKIRRIYTKNFAEKSDQFSPFIETLKTHSKERIESSSTYQEYLKKAASPDLLTEEDFTNPQNDFQLQETFQVIKELIFLTDKRAKSSN